MLRLNQIVALVKGKKARASTVLTACHRIQGDAVTGIIRKYTPNDEDGEVFPPESKVVPHKIEQEIFPLLTETLAQYYDVVATQEEGNTKAKGNVVVDGKTILQNVPVTVLLFLEKQIVDLLTFTKKIPVLAADKEWTYSDTKGCYLSEKETKTKTAKVPKVVIKYEATKEHPAQTELFSEDRTIGKWDTHYLSGAVPAKTRDDIIERLQKLQDAVKSAREEANSTELKEIMKLGEPFFKYIFGN